VNVPGIILEHGFHTHSATVRWLLNDANLDRMAQNEAACIDQFFRNAEEQKNEVWHVVKKGDTLSKIARAYGTSLTKILQLNPAITNPNKIYVGQKIRIR